MTYPIRPLPTLSFFVLIISLAFACKSQKQTYANPQATNDLSTHEIDSVSTAIDESAEENPQIGQTDIPSMFRDSFGQDIESFISKSEIFSSHFTGFSLYDLQSNAFVVNYNGSKYFTPASNVKVLTLYAALKSFDRMLPGALVLESPDTLFIRPIGDPTFVHPDFQYQPLLEKIKKSVKPIAIEWPNTEMDAFGIGWMWDDYNSGYMPELSWMPMYGNVVHFQYDRPNVTASPPLFNDLIEITRVRDGRSNKIVRSPEFNFFTAHIRYPNWSFEKNIPFRFSKSLAIQLLEQESGKDISLNKSRGFRMDTLYSQPIDTVLRKMMQASDNFVSEQLLIMAALKNGFSNTEAFREYMSAEWLQGIEPVWIDGSGLSRYNLVRPMDKVKLLNLIYDEYGWNRIKNIFAEGGVSGTIKEWYANEPNPDRPYETLEPYIVAKTGTLSNNHNLSGYLVARSGKLLSFSFMNNNFVRPTSEVKEEMQKLLEGIRDSY